MDSEISTKEDVAVVRPLRAVETVARLRRSPEADGLARLAELELALDDLERTDLALVRRVEEQRSEIVCLKVRIRERTARPIARGADTDAVAAQTQASERDVARLQAGLDDRLSAFEQSLRKTHDLRGSLRGQRAALQGERQTILDRLAPSMRIAYEDLLRSGEAPVIAAVRGGACSACTQTVPAEALVAARASGDPRRCPRCRRLLLEEE